METIKETVCEYQTLGAIAHSQMKVNTWRSSQGKPTDLGSLLRGVFLALEVYASNEFGEPRHTITVIL